MLAIPAIDLLDGRCVRLEQGDFAKVSVYDNDARNIARNYCASGAERLHVVDLDAAREGTRRHLKTIGEIAAIAHEHGAKLQVGGGVRKISDLEELLSAGVDWAVIGTAAVRDPQLLVEACSRYPGQILAGLDARARKLAVHGWTETSSVLAIDFARQAAAAGCAGIVFTAILRDGMLNGCDCDATAEMASAASCPVYASGGFASIDELDSLHAAGAAGAIIGKALYAGTIRLEEALARAQQLRANGC